MKCPYCGRKVSYSPALKGALRKGPIERTCAKCGRSMVIKPEDIKDPIEKRIKHQARRWRWGGDDRGEA